MAEKTLCLLKMWQTAEGCVSYPIAQCSRVTWSFSCQFWPSEAPVDSKCALICILQFLVAESLAGMKNYFCCLPFKHQRVLLKDTQSTHGLCAAHHAWGLYNIHILWPLLVCHKYQTNHVKWELHLMSVQTAPVVW